MTSAKTTPKPLRQCPPATNCPKAGKLGGLSAKYESGGRGAAAIGFDRTGGWSYGKYQIATRTGTMRSFLRYVQTKSPIITKELTEAGGSVAATAGEQRFKAAWVKAAKDPGFEMLQHNYIRDSHYRPLVASLKSDIGLNFEERSSALQDVAWSVAVQHGAGSKVIQNALHGKVVESMTDEEIIDAIYDERGTELDDAYGNKALKYFRSSSQAVQNGIKRRYEYERQCAKQMLQSEIPKGNSEGGDAVILPESLWI